MSFSHAQGLRDTLHRLRDTYAPPTAEEIQLFTQALTEVQSTQAEPKPLWLDLQRLIPSPELVPKPRQIPVNIAPPKAQELPSVYYYPPEPVETRW